MNYSTALLYRSLNFYQRLTNAEHKNAFELMKKGELMSAGEMRELKNRAFLNLIKHAYTNIPFYKKKYAEHGVSENDIKSIDDIIKLPILTKDDIKSNYPTIVWGEITGDTIYGTSGGTTGEPMKIYQDRRCYYMEYEALYRGMNWMGWKPGYGMVRLFGGSLGGRSKNLKSYIRKKVTGTLYLPAFELTPANAKSYLDEIKNQGETFIQGYCSSIYDLALYIKKFNYTGLKIKGVFTTAEQLALEQAQLMKEIYQAPVKSFYGCGEINAVGFQLEENGHYLIPDEVNHVENYSNNLSKYNLLLTSLYNYKMPMIRYLNGDAGIVVPPEKTGLSRHIISELQGRTSDMFIRPDGSYISSILATQTMHVSVVTHKIRKYQLFQTGPSTVNIIYVPFSEKLSVNEEQHIVAIYQKRIGSDFKITINENSDFIVSSSGKHRLMINNYIK